MVAGGEADEEDAEGLSEYRDAAVPEDLLQDVSGAEPRPSRLGKRG